MARSRHVLRQCSRLFCAGCAAAGRGCAAASFGREVYISEGCMHCHSPYVRPNSNDEIMWGPSSDVQVRRSERPPLIGNRHQGPDLTEVGNRRSAPWLRAHFMNPAMLSHDSPMPAYAYLFADERGDALIAYMKTLGGTNLFAHLEMTHSHSLAIIRCNYYSGETTQWSCVIANVLRDLSRRQSRDAANLAQPIQTIATGFRRWTLRICACQRRCKAGRNAAV